MGEPPPPRSLPLFLGVSALRMPPTMTQVPSLPCRAPRCCSAPLDPPGDADPGHGCAAKSPYPPAQDLVDSCALLQGALSNDFCPHLFHIQHESVQGLLDSGLLGFLLSLWFWLRFPWQGHKRSSQCQQSEPPQHPDARCQTHPVPNSAPAHAVLSAQPCAHITGDNQGGPRGVGSPVTLPTYMFRS